jgi:transposase
MGRKELESRVPDPWASRRRRELLRLLDQLNPWIADLDREVEEQAKRCPETNHLMKQPGVGPVTALTASVNDVQRG